jgi:hypothetical protein
MTVEEKGNDNGKEKKDERKLGLAGDAYRAAEKASSRKYHQQDV